MSAELITRVLNELESVTLIDPHSHINPHSPASENLADILGYHYYTELAHSAGMPKGRVEEPGLDPREKVGRLAEYLPRLSNTVQHSWFIEMCQKFFNFDDTEITSNNWESLYDSAQKVLDQPDWEDQCLSKSGIERVFLTNDFDDPLTGFDTKRYIPCLRTDDLVFHFTKPATRERLQKASGTDVTNPQSLKAAIGKLFEHFTAKDAKACAISIPPDFTPAMVSDADVATVLEKTLKGDELSKIEAARLSQYVFWSIAEFCSEFKLPFDLMIGVNRQVYPEGVFQGQDLYDKRTSLIQYKELFNTFSDVTFPISVLTTTSNQELVSYAWIFPNVVTNGHWWYSNIPTYIAADCRSRLEAVPQTKQIGYYSDMYKLEFALPKFAMYRRILAGVLAENFVVDRGWTEERAVALGRMVLRDNVDQIFQT
ncbi:MAG: glucuronate isomerase [Planctomycetaceae bacterium]